MGIPPENLNNKHTNMKKIMIFSAIFAVAISLSACSNNETDISYASAETITLSSTALNFEKEGGTQTAEVESTHEFAAYSNDSWIKVTPTNPVGKKATITVTVGENQGAERTGNITIWSGGSRQNITVTQAKGGQNITCPIEGYNLVWNDEFSDNELGPDWTYEIKPAGWVNNELQTYVREDKVAQVSNGTLKINLLDDGGTIKSARLYARESTGWKYGYIEASIKLPKGKGTWPAFWMMPVNWQQWPGDGEIDIMESVGYDPDVVVSTIHCTKYNNSGTTIESARRKISNSQTEFHTYGMEWTAEYMTFYVDGEELLTYRNDGSGKEAWPFDAAFYPILNLAWGGTWGGGQGVDPSCLPATMEVDYVRVFQK